jgi:hypothetical protein
VLKSAALLLIALLSIKVTPQIAMSFKPVPVTVRARISTPTDDMRSISASIIGADYGRSSTITLEGAASAPMHVFEWREVPPGEYTVVVEVYDSSNNVLARDTKPVKIVGIE